MTELVAGLREMGARIGVSSLRADSLSEDLLRALVASGNRTVTLAPEAGSQRLRQRIGKGITEDHLRRAAELCRAQRRSPRSSCTSWSGCRGRPTRTWRPSPRWRGQMAAWSGARATVSVAPFVPKAQTPFERQPMADTAVLHARLDSLRRDLPGRPAWATRPRVRSGRRSRACWPGATGRWRACCWRDAREHPGRVVALHGRAGAGRGSLPGRPRRGRGAAVGAHSGVATAAARSP